ncbi:MAG: DinB family protein [Phycisphaeraceae bacterium]|nr:MAG: DinB family protein [Phycisphaeraceae bacterium]
MYDSRTLESLVHSTAPLFLRFLAGFDDENRTQQASGLPNHVSWTLGHVALTMHRAADVIAGFDKPQHLPTSDWVHGDGTAGDPSRYDTESVGYGSTPKADKAKYPRMKRAIEIYEAAVERLASEVASASELALEREVKWGSTTLEAGALVQRVVFHTGTHTGQVIDLRRALGMAGVLG